MRIEPASREHFARIRPQRNQVLARVDETTEPFIRQAVASPFAWAILDGEVVVALFGAIEFQPGIGTAWALLCDDMGSRRLLRLTRTIHDLARDHLEQFFRRVEFVVEAGYVEGAKWAEMLGFELEGYMHHFGPDGSDFLLYARWRD